VSRKFTGYIVLAEDRTPLHLGGDGILWRSSTYQPVTIFKTRQAAESFAEASLRVARKRGYSWGSDEFFLQGVHNA